MPKLHLVAITSDNKGLVLSEQAGSNRGDLVLDIDDRLLDAIDRAQRQRARDEGQKLSSAALPSKREVPEDTGERPSPRQIQDRIRAGESVAAIAKAGGVDEEWVEKFAPPVVAELEQIAKQARDLTFTKRGFGPSKTTLAGSVAANLAERGAEMTDEEIDAGWSAYQRPGGEWIVVFSFPAKGRRQKAEWTVDLGTGELVARSKLATELGFREGSTRAAPKPAPAKPARPKPAAAKPVPADLEVAAETGGEPEALAAAEVTEPEAVLAVESVPEPVDDGVQTLPGTFDDERDLEQILDSVGIAPGPPAEPEPAAPAPAPAPEAVEPPSSPEASAAGESDPTKEVSLPARPEPAPARRPQPPTSSS